MNNLKNHLIVIVNLPAITCITVYIISRGEITVVNIRTAQGWPLFRNSFLCFAYGNDNLFSYLITDDRKKDDIIK